MKKILMITFFSLMMSLNAQEKRIDTLLTENIKLQTELANERAKSFILEERLKDFERKKLKYRIKIFFKRLKNGTGSRPKTKF